MNEPIKLRPRAIRDDRWANKPLSYNHQRIEVRRRYSSYDWDGIQLGRIPADDDDKWFIYTEGYSVHFHRSWTGICIYTAKFEPCEAGVNLIDALVCNDPDQYIATDLDEDREMLYSLIDMLIQDRFATDKIPEVGPVTEPTNPMSKHSFKKIIYKELNSRQQENYNFQKVSAVLADYGFATIRLSDDWQGADFIAQHKDGNTFLKVQLKGRLSFYSKYQGRDIYVCFPSNSSWFLYPHDELLEEVLKVTKISTTEAWVNGGGYSFSGIPEYLMPLLQPYRLE